MEILPLQSKLTFMGQFLAGETISRRTLFVKGSSILLQSAFPDVRIKKEMEEWLWSSRNFASFTVRVLSIYAPCLDMKAAGQWCNQLYDKQLNLLKKNQTQK